MDASQVVAVEFDGVLFDGNATTLINMGDEPISGSVLAIRELWARYEVVVLTVREEVDLVRDWMAAHGFPHEVDVYNIAHRPYYDWYISRQSVRFTSWDDVLPQFAVDVKPRGYLMELGTQGHPEVWDIAGVMLEDETALVGVVYCRDADEVRESGAKWKHAWANIGQPELATCVVKSAETDKVVYEGDSDEFDL